ncbi:lipoprotein, putative [Xanthomonas oryzae pv. oryzae PXO99A]|uniref:Lipoprotein, putative n=1 Tax=Xanthomonas oryzae pv. oryzae (strain PXO99A) TaxID=360094 RepID=A0A0K0GK31_XANOP|nr:lipoprotein, putative [Xanthomonas oryzae pv. oryzae PXO99A]
MQRDGCVPATSSTACALHAVECLMHSRGAGRKWEHLHTHHADGFAGRCMPDDSARTSTISTPLRP